MRGMFQAASGFKFWIERPPPTDGAGADVRVRPRVRSESPGLLRLGSLASPIQLWSRSNDAMPATLRVSRELGCSDSVVPVSVCLPEFQVRCRRLVTSGNFLERGQRAVNRTIIGAAPGRRCSDWHPARAVTSSPARAAIIGWSESVTGRRRAGPVGPVTVT
jgi:hypothetical protein